MHHNVSEELVEIDSPSGVLEGLLAYPSDTMPGSTVLFLSPHPQLGGNMENNVVRYLARAAAQFGHATLRFNYHGVGKSTIQNAPPISLPAYWSEIERTRTYERLIPDVNAAWNVLQATLPNASGNTVVGYSLGAVLAGITADIFPDANVVAIAPPFNRVVLTGFDRYRCEKVFVTGDRDFCFEPEAFSAFFDSLPKPKRHVLLADKDHFFRKSEPELFREIEPWLALGATIRDSAAVNG